MKRAILGGILLASAFGTAPASAQIRASERALVTQMVDGTRLEIDYARPRARGRGALFGHVVHWGEVWTPGANEATTLRVSKDVHINGHALAAGRYSLWLVVQREGDWTLLFDRDTARFHTIPPNPDSVHLRFDVTPVTGPPTEVLTWSFPAIEDDSATLELAWGTVHIPLRIAVPPTHTRTIAAEAAAPYVGSYEIEWLWEEGSTSPPARFTIAYEAADSTLRATTPMFGGMQTVLLMPVAEGIFVPAFLTDGILDTTENTFLEFAANGAAAFEVRDEKEDRIVGRGKRKP